MYLQSLVRVSDRMKISTPTLRPHVKLSSQNMRDDAWKSHEWEFWRLYETPILPAHTERLCSIRRPTVGVWRQYVAMAGPALIGTDATAGCAHDTPLEEG
jgi:hypothetical protein